MTHFVDPFVPSPQTSGFAEYNDYEDIGLKETLGKENMSQEQVMEMLKMHERLLYTILATIGIPCVIFVIFYIEVSFC